MARTITSGRLATLNGQHVNFYFRVEIENPDGGWTALTNLFGFNFFNSATWTDNIDQPVQTGSVVLHREFTDDAGLIYSLSPTVAASVLNRDASNAYARLVRAGRKIRIFTNWTADGVAPDAGDWLEVFLGRVDEVEWGTSDPVVTLAIRDAGAWLIDNFIEAEVDYSDDTGHAVELIMQQILDDNIDPKVGPIALYTPVSPGWNIKAFTQAKKSVMDALRDLALQIGWDVRYKWDDTAGLFRLTFYQPDRAKSAADYALGPDHYFNVAQLKEGDANVRNRIKATSHDPANVLLESVANDASSQATFGLKYMEVNEEASSNIDTQSELDAMTAAILSDLAAPRADQEIENLFFPIAEIGDLGRWLANGRHYDADQFLAVVQVRHEIAKDKHRSFIQTRGEVAGAYYEWLRRRGEGGTDDGTPDASTLKLKNWREIRRTADSITFGFEASTGTFKIAVYEFVQGETADVNWPDGSSPPTRWLTADTTEVTFLFPPAGSVRYAQIQPADEQLHFGEFIRQRVFADGTPPKLENEKQETSISGLYTALSFDVIDYKALGGTLKAWTNEGSEDSADSTATPDGTVAIGGTPAHIDGTTAFLTPAGSTDALLSHIRVHPGRGKRVYVEFTNTDGISSGVIAINLLSQGGIIDANGQIIDEAINAASQFAANISPVLVLATLPGTAADNTLVFNTTDGQLYRRSAGSWTLEVKAVNISGQLVTTQIADAAISVAKFATGLKPVELLSATTGAPGLNRIAYNTTDGKLYKSSSTGTAWETAGASAFGDLSGQITTTQITPGSITAPLMAANSVTAASILAGTITSGLIAAGAITTTQLAAGAVNTAALAAGAVTAVKITAGTITTNEIAVGTITATNMAANSITSAQLTAGSVIAGKLAAGAINASTLFVSGVVTATIISVSNLAAISNNLGIIVSGKLNSANGQSYIDLNATGASPFIHHANSSGVTSMEILANGSATFYGTVASTLFTGASAAFAGSVIVGTNMQIGNDGSATLRGITWPGSHVSLSYAAVFSDGNDLTLGGYAPVSGGQTANVLKRVKLTSLPMAGVVIDQTGTGPSNATNYTAGDLWLDIIGLHFYVNTGSSWAAIH